VDPYLDTALKSTGYIRIICILVIRDDVYKEQGKRVALVSYVYGQLKFVAKFVGNITYVVDLHVSTEQIFENN
jgi:hypothetical protein